MVTTYNILFELICLSLSVYPHFLLYLQEICWVAQESNINTACWIGTCHVIGIFLTFILVFSFSHAVHCWISLLVSELTSSHKYLSALLKERLMQCSFINIGQRFCLSKKKKKMQFIGSFFKFHVVKLKSWYT